jgi:hypothetical protein
MHRHSKKFIEAKREIERLDGVEAKAEYLMGRMKDVIQTQLALDKRKTGLLWRAYGLILFAPWGHVRLSVRIEVLAVLLYLNGLMEPIRRFRLRSYLFMARIGTWCTSRNDVE